jgi:hypothetical protein
VNRARTLGPPIVVGVLFIAGWELFVKARDI